MMMLSTVGAVRMHSACRLAMRTTLKRPTTTAGAGPRHHLRAKSSKAGRAPLNKLKAAQQRSTNTTTKTQSSRSSSSRSSSSLQNRQKATLAGNTSMHAVKQIERQQTFWQALDQILRKPRTIPIPRWISPRHHTITLSEICGHSSFLLVAMSYAVDDFLTLRMVAVAGSTVMLFFTYWHPHGRVLWLPLKWNVLFIAINSYRISKIYLDRYRAEQLSPELMELRQKHVFLMDPVDFLHLVRVGNIVDYNKGDVVLSQGERNPHVFLVLRGTLKVSRDKKLTYLMNEGNFISESGLHVGLLLHGSVESCCSVEADSNARVLCWDRNKLVDLMEHDPSLRRSLKAVLSLDLIDKLKMQRSLLSMGLIDDPEEWTKRRTEQTQHRYAAILRNLLSHPGDLVQRRRELNKYRKIHHINEDFHNEVLLMAGWTPEEFAAGHKDGEHHWSKDDDAFKRDWKWYAKDVYFHIFG